MLRSIAAMAVLVLLPVTSFAQDAEAPSAERIALYVGAIRDNGCTLSVSDAPKVLGGKGFTKDESRSIARALFEDGTMKKSDDGSGVALSDAACKGTD